MMAPRREHLLVVARPAAHGVTVVARGHHLAIDEAERYGGHDAGANPVEHLLAGIASASLVVLRLLGEGEIAGSATLSASAQLNVDRVLGTGGGPVFESIRLDWEVESPQHAERLRAMLARIAIRRPGQPLIDAASASTEVVSIREMKDMRQQ